MKKDEIQKIVEDPKKERYLLWCGYITNETEKGRQLEYFGKFCKTKHSAIGGAKLMIDNTDIYRIIIQDTEPFKIDPSKFQTELEDFFPLERDDE